MAALEPIKVIITNFDEEAAKAKATGEGMTFEVQNSPTDETLGSHSVTLTSTIYIDASDFRLKDAKTYYGLAPSKAVGLKYYGGNLFCTDVITDTKTGKPVELKCTIDKTDGRKKPKSFVTWVPADGIQCEVRVYDHLFSVTEPTDRWEEELNSKSETVHPNAIVDPSVRETVDGKHVDRWTSNPALQFERLGYFVVDVDTVYDASSNAGKLVFNRTVSLKAEIKVHEKTDAELAAIDARRTKTKADEAAKKERLKIAPEDFFTLAAEFVGKFTKYDDTGLPTHDKEGVEVTKSMRKKLEKERNKHKKALMKAAKAKK